jgi:hypothetical protein
VTTQDRWIWLSVGAASAGVIVMISLSGGPAEALPMYAQRSGRTCGNCHVSPTLEDPEGWDNPALPDRKCTLSCISCHVDPTGGGQRNSSGRYFGQSTISMFHTQDRSYSDLQRELMSDVALWEFQQKHGREPTVEEGQRLIPSDWEDVQAGMGDGQTGNRYVFGEPRGGVDEMAFWDGRYDDLNADPAVSFGADIRGAWWSGTSTTFPMQIDLHGAVHPIEHLTIAATAAARGRTDPIDTFTAPDSRMFARRAFVMAHELPYMSWAKAGIFMPSFGTYIDDHTAYTREFFEMDTSHGEDSVLGVEVGMAPNYPFASVSLFKNDASLGGDPDPGWGSAVNLGWRDLGWSLTGHAMVKERGGEGRGDLATAGIGWGFNPFYYSNRIPLTYMGELTAGQRTIGTDVTQPVAMMHEVWWMVRNGVNIRGRWDYGALEQGLWQSRYSATLDYSPFPGLSLLTTGRIQQSPDGAPAGRDLMVQAHIWF